MILYIINFIKFNPSKINLLIPDTVLNYESNRTRLTPLNIRITKGYSKRRIPSCGRGILYPFGKV